MKQDASAVTRDDIAEAESRVQPYIRRTPVFEIAGTDFGIDQPVNLKLELFQHAGSFKVRGAFNNLLARRVPTAGVAAASGGNHGAAVAYCAKRLGFKANIFVPEISSPAKLARIRASGATMHVNGQNYAAALLNCQSFQEEYGAIGIHAYAEPLTIAGQGTLASEWARQAPDLDTLLVAVGGAGLISGIAAYHAGATKIVGVEPENACALHAALGAGRPVDVNVNSMAADSLGATSVGALNHAICARYVDHVALVPESAIRQALGRLWTEYRIAAEPGGAAAFAALLSGAYTPAKGERLGILVCGGNVDPALVAEASQ